MKKKNIILNELFRQYQTDERTMIKYKNENRKKS